VAALMPFVSNATTESKVATGLINVVLGVGIGTLLNGVAGSAVRVRRAGG
jgi:hypothetical protein